MDALQDGIPPRFSWESLIFTPATCISSCFEFSPLCHTPLMSQNYITLKIVLQLPSEQDHRWAQNKHSHGKRGLFPGSQTALFHCAPNNRPPLISVEKTILCNALISWEDNVKVQMSLVISSCMQRNNHQSLTAQTQHTARAVPPLRSLSISTDWLWTSMILPRTL